MNYRELQQSLKTYKAQGLTTVKLNSKKTVLESEYKRLTEANPSSPKLGKCLTSDEVSEVLEKVPGARKALRDSFKNNSNIGWSTFNKEEWQLLWTSGLVEHNRLTATGSKLGAHFAS